MLVDGERAPRWLDYFAIAASGKIDVTERRISFRTIGVEGAGSMRGCVKGWSYPAVMSALNTSTVVAIDTAKHISRDLRP